MIYIRVDCNDKIASGHLARCITIADALVKEGEEVCFISADNGIEQALVEKGYPFKILNTSWNNMVDEVAALKIAIGDVATKPVLLIDSYAITEEYVLAVSQFTKPCYLGSKKIKLGPLCALIDYNIEIDEDFYSTNYNDCELLLGARYAPIKSDFIDNKISKPTKINKVLITTGGTNQNHTIEDILSALTTRREFDNLNFSVVIGAMFHDISTLKNRFKAYRNISFVEKQRNLAPIMREHDIAIAACGTTIYEMAAINLPIIAFSMVEEQIHSAKCFADAGAIWYCGESYPPDTQCATKICEQLKFACTNIDELVKLTDTANRLIDGCGSQRIAQKLIELGEVK